MKFSSISLMWRLVLGLALMFNLGYAQQSVDRIIAVIGEDIVLDSDIDNQYNYLIINGQKDDGSLRCQVMEGLIVNKLLLDKAKQDSIEVSDGQVEGELSRRMEYILSQVPVEKFEEIYGKSVSQFREDIREDIYKELLINQQRSIIESETDITPKEVREFFKNIDPDSLGYLPSEVQINHIVIKPPYSEESRQAANDLLDELRKKVLEDGIDFNQLAARNSDEPNALRSGGSLGEFGRGQMVKAFEEVVFNMRPGEVSQPFETEFGVHIVKLHERRGEVVKASHILKQLRYSSNGDSIAIDSLNSILELIAIDSLSFERAAINYSQDRISSQCGGCIANPQTQELRIPMDALDPEMYFKIDEMSPGEISKPLEYRLPDGSRAFHVLYLRSKVPPHLPNMNEDNQKIRNAALLAKRAENFEKWLERAKKNIYIDIKSTECQNALKNWLE
ncbi:MAG: peptidylprolyl isomerase [Bacteroidota bacterium]